MTVRGAGLRATWRWLQGGNIREAEARFLGLGFCRRDLHVFRGAVERREGAAVLGG